MSQTDELATKRVFGVITFLMPDNLFSCRFSSFHVVAVLLQELIVFSYRIQVYCASMVHSDESASF